MLDALKRHWPEYLIEGAALAAFMISASLFAVVLEHPGSPLHRAIPEPFVRRALMGLSMGLTAIAIIFSPWGKRSGAHMNPSITLTFFRLGKIDPPDALFYVSAQFAGGVVGLLLAAVVLGATLSNPHIDYVATLPGPHGVGAAFAAEAAISFVLVLVVLTVSNTAPIARYTGLFAGALVATWITFEAPISGMSMNPARTLASNAPAGHWADLWIYFTAPPLGMLLAAQLYGAVRGARSVACAKLHHDNNERCIFRCGRGNTWFASKPGEVTRRSSSDHLQEAS